MANASVSQHDTLLSSGLVEDKGIEEEDHHSADADDEIGDGQSGGIELSTIDIHGDGGAAVDGDDGTRLVGNSGGGNAFGQLYDEDEVEAGTAAPAHQRHRHRREPWCTPVRFAIIAFVTTVLVLGLVLVVFGGPPSDPVAPRQGIGPCAPGSDMWRLPKDVAPYHYTLSLRPLLVEPFDFSGSVVIDTRVKSSTSSQGVQCVYLHLQELDIASVVVSLDEGSPVAPVATQHNSETTLLGIRLPWNAAVGSRVRLHLTFHGKLNLNMVGLYLSQYLGEDGSLLPMVVTQFQATNTRRAFPCFDEPGFKAVFELTLQGVPAGFTALSNMPVSHTLSLPSSRTITFQPTPIMSCYLLAASIGKMGSVGTTVVSHGRSIEVRVWARTAMVSQLTFALETAGRVLAFYGDFYDSPFPLPKCDLVAVPDSAFGAMENWGMLVFREPTLVGTRAGSSQAALQVIAMIVSHEIAHQWTGDLVTVEWWQYLWLNEGFASYMEFVGTEAAQPSFGVWDHFLLYNTQPAMLVDSFVASHSLSGRVVETPQQIETQFDGISYSKGASIIRMVASFMQGQRGGSFQDGMAAYIRKFQYSNTVPDDLWASLSTALPAPTMPDDSLTTRLQPYTLRSGVPVVTFEWRGVTDPAVAATTTSGTLVVSQRRFFASSYSRQLASAQELSTVWWIPLTLAAERGEAVATGVAAAAAQAASSGGFASASWATTIEYDLGRDGWIKANMNQTGYYRVNYPVAVWQRFAKTLPQQLGNASSSVTPGATLYPNDRAQLLGDSFALWYSGELDAATVLPLARFLAYERTSTVWETAFHALEYVHGMLFADILPVDGTAQACIDDFAAYARALVAPVLQAVGWDGSPSDSAALVAVRSGAIASLSYFGHADTIAEAQRRFDAFKANASTPLLPADIRAPVFASVVRWGGVEGFQDMLAQYRGTEASLHNTALLALAATRNGTLIQSALQFAITDEVRSQATPRLVSAIARNPYGRERAWVFVTTQWPLFAARYGSGNFAMPRLVTAVTGYFVSTPWLNAADAFWRANDFGGAKLEALRAIEQIGARRAWQASQLQSTCQWLKDN